MWEWERNGMRRELVEGRGTTDAPLLSHRELACIGDGCCDRPGGVNTRGTSSGPRQGSSYMNSYRVSSYYIAPGWYGTSYGFASYGMPQTYSVYSAYPGPSYGSTSHRMDCSPDATGSACGGRGMSPLDTSTVRRTTHHRRSPIGRSLSSTGRLGAPLAAPPSIGVYAPRAGPRLVSARSEGSGVEWS